MFFKMQPQERLFSDYFRLLQQSVQTMIVDDVLSTIVNNYLQCFLEAPIRNNFFRLFPTIAIVGANNDCQRCFAQDQLVKRVAKSSKWPTNLNYYFVLKHRFNHSFPMFSDVLRCFPMFFRFQPSLTTISDLFLNPTIGTTFFKTIFDGCNSCCKRSSSTILRPGLLRMIESM